MEVADLAVNRFIEALKRRGIYDDSLIIYTADHGEMNCHLALVDKGCYIHPETQRVPLVIKPPAGFGAGNRTVEEPVSLLDIASTVCDVAGVEPLERMDGISLVPCLKGGALPEGRELMFQTGWQITGNPACGTVRRRPDGSHHMYVYNVASATDELYDMNDPDPQNLAHRPEHQEVRVEMVRRMAELIRTGSPLRMLWDTAFRCSTTPSSTAPAHRRRHEYERAGAAEPAELRRAGVRRADLGSALKSWSNRWESAAVSVRR